MKKTRFRQLKVDYKKIAELKGVSVYSVRAAVKRGVLDPRDVLSICRYINKEDI